MSKEFVLIQNKQAEREQTYCDTTYHITVIWPEHRYSGVPATVSLAACNCDEKHSTKSEDLPASDVAVTHPNKRAEDDPFPVPEATGEPDLSNSAIEGSVPEPEVIEPQSSDEFEKL